MLDQRLEIIRNSLKFQRKNTILAQDELTLVAVSKQQPPDRVLEALNCGVRDFGENRVQEAMERWKPLREQYDDLTLHMIGPLQRNKVRDVVGFFDVLHSLDRIPLADELAEELDKKGAKLPCFIQVNTGDEEQKAGVSVREFDALLAHCREQAKLDIVGLMCIPPADEHPAPHFALLHELAKNHGLSGLSMGMSGDWEVAIRFGATHIRLGAALFGDRSI